MNRINKLVTKDINISVLVVLAILITIVLEALLSPDIFSGRNLSSMGYQIPEFGFIALAMMLAVLTGGIDLSIIANANLSGILAGFILTGSIFGANSGIPPVMLIIITIITTIVVSTLLGLINGILIAKISVPPILATLGTMLLYKGLGMAITSGKGIVGFPDAFLKISAVSIFGIPVIFIIFIIAAIILAIILSKTAFGKKIYLFGENSVATKFSAINNDRVILMVYALCGLLAGIASIIMISRVNSAKVGYGDTFLLQALLVAVLGGVDPDGGRGKVFGVTLGIFILQILQSAFTLWQFTPYAKNLIWGVMLIIVMVVNYIINNNKLRIRKRG